MVKVLISDKLGDDAVRILEARKIEVVFNPDLGKDPAALKEALQDVDGLAIRSATKMTAELIEAAPKLKVIGRAGIGVDNIDIDAATAAGIAVMNTPFGNAVTTAEHAIAMMFAVARKIPQADASTKQSKWEKSKFMGRELFGKTLGLIGAGNIGGIVASRAQGLRMKVIAFDPFLSEEKANDMGVELVSLNELLQRADFISLHTPLNDKTRNIISREALEVIRPGAFIINCARGGLIDEDALAEALDDGRVAGAALDVFAEEPAKNHPIFERENVVVTPHLGASTREAQENVAVQIAEQIADYLLTGAVQNALNMPSVTADEAPKLKPFINLGEKLGSLAGQLVDGAITGISVRFAGHVSELKAGPIVSGVVSSALKPQLATVNAVNATSLAKDRGISITEEKTETSPNFGSTLTVKVETANGAFSVTGALFGGEPRIVRIGDVRLEASLAPNMLFVINEDKPGFIGALGDVLSDAKVNIATFNLGRQEAGGEAMALIALDQELSDDTLRAINALPQIKRAAPLKF
ncbi:phosphoglycerate dehydrogenase [Parvularcula lutaonensis]|uniref:D-3-phosphoglycerate dehydrogenase n=1 Tax=Parvularcula lutaonensis TaxID=491923 RepID=A0ABV7MCJ6_9PROT|nr:phosphoglycerate dehydrogenase [Parvularcula lutaonensis]GGY50999.1 D-3-phosphoglycerate dehydrogenase [Parvularcula lutaonensis]